MNDIAIVIDEISEKLGVAANEIYAVLQMQAKVQAIKSIIFCLVCIGTILFTCLFIKKYFSEKRYEDETVFEHHESLDDGYDIVLIIAATVLIIISVVFLIMLIFEVSTVVDCIFNPKYWALKNILQ